jgi:predicted Zn-dependent protease with MMP-like domain
MPDKITIYRGELLRMGLRGRELVEEIRITVLHEIGHYFGLDDDQMEEMGY